jgi:PTH1 family peptidyl-tRNA hydrolase
LNAVAKAFDAEDFSFDKKMNALVAKGKIGKEKVTFIEPETFMNNSGKALVSMVKVKANKKLKLKTADNFVVIYDDFQLPLGRIKISFNRSSGGHNGLESVIKAVKTEAFVRIRVGTAAENAKGNARVPHGDEKVLKFILGKYKDDEMKELKKVSKKAAEAVEMIVKEGREKAMSVFNAG